MYSLLKERSERQKKSVVEFTQDLIRIPSPTSREDEAAKRIECHMRELNYDKVFRDGAGNVVGILFGRENDTTILLNSHIDTVTAQDDLWTGSPYSGRIENGRIYGLGASDCKGGLAAQIYAGDLLKRSLLPLQGNLVVAATVSEENGRSLGVRALIEETLPEQGLIPTYAILGEPTEGGLYYGHDGWMKIEVRAEGQNPFQVDDAAQAIYNDFNAVYHKRNFDERQGSFLVQQPRFDNNQGVRRATIELERRVKPSEEIDDILGQIRHNVSLVAHSIGGVAVNVDVHRDTQQHAARANSAVQRIVNAWSIDPFGRLIDRARQALAAAGCEAHPGKWKLEHRGMGTAGGTLVNEYNIPTIGYGPGCEHLAHTPDEYVEIDKIHEAVYGTSVIVQDLIGFPVFGWTSDEI